MVLVLLIGKEMSPAQPTLWLLKYKNLCKSRDYESPNQVYRSTFGGACHSHILGLLENIPTGNQSCHILLG